MSWQRDYAFFTQTNFPFSGEWDSKWEEENKTRFCFSSRSDCFGWIVHNIIYHFSDLAALHFLKEADDGAYIREFTLEAFTERLVSFDAEQQRQVIAAIDKFFAYAQTQPIIFAECAAKIDSNPWDEQLKMAEIMTSENFYPSYDNDTFVTAMLIMRLIKAFFEQALEQKLYVGYYDYIA